MEPQANENETKPGELTREQPQKRLEGEWAPAGERLDLSQIPPGLTAINLQGRQAAGALQGFGQLWKKTYQVRLTGVELSAPEVMQIWKTHFAELQPPGNRFVLPEEGLKPGKVIGIDSPLPVMPPMYNKPGVVPMSSGVLVMYNDEESFAVMTPEGFPVSGWNNFSVYEDDGAPVAQVQSFERASDPIYECGFRFMAGSKRQEFIWIHVLTGLAEKLNIEAQVTMVRECLDPQLQWKYAGKVWQNAGIRTTFYTLASPFRWAGRRLKG